MVSGLGLFSGLLFAKTPRPLLNVPILNPQGKPIELRRYRGRTVLLMIFSTQCDDCIRTIQVMNKLQTDLGPKGLQIVGAAGDPNAKYVLGPFIERYRPLFPMGYIEKEAIIKVAEIGPGVHPVVPMVLFIDRWGMVREQYFGNSPVVQGGESSLRSLALAMLDVAPVGAREH